MSGLLSFTGMLPDRFTGMIVKSDQVPRESVQIEILVDNQNIGLIESKDLDPFQISTHEKGCSRYLPPEFQRFK